MSPSASKGTTTRDRQRAAVTGVVVPDRYRPRSNSVAVARDNTVISLDLTIVHGGLQ